MTNLFGRTVDNVPFNRSLHHTKCRNIAILQYEANSIHLFRFSLVSGNIPFPLPANTLGMLTLALIRLCSSVVEQPPCKR